MAKRFEKFNGICGDIIKDNQTDKEYTEFDADELVDLLNKQDQEIKELESQVEYYHDFEYWREAEKENQQLKLKLRKQDLKINKLESKLKTFYREGLLQKQFDKDVEIENLQHSQNSKAIEMLEQVKNDIILNIPDKYGEIKTLPNGHSTYYVDRPTVITFINNQITKLRGGK